MKKIELIKGILELREGLKTKDVFSAVTVVNEMELLVDKYVESLGKESREVVKQFTCEHNWTMVGHQFNGHEECTKCGKIGKTF